MTEEAEQEKAINASVVAFSPSVFGAPTWEYLHLYTLRYPVHPTDKDKADADTFLQVVFERLGCLGCVQHILAYKKAHPVALESRASLVWWLYTAHNDVNARRKVPEMTRSEFIDYYVKYKRPQKQKTNGSNATPIQTSNELVSSSWKGATILLTLLLFVLLLWFIYVHLQKQRMQ